MRRSSPQHAALASELHDSFVNYVTKRVDRLGLISFDVESGAEPPAAEPSEAGRWSPRPSVRGNAYIPKVVTTIVETMVEVKAYLCDGIFRKPCNAVKHETQKKRMKDVRARRGDEA